MKNIIAKGGIEFLAVFLGIALSLWVDQYQKSENIYKDIYKKLKKIYLNILENYDLQKMGLFSSEYIHLFTEAKKIVFAKHHHQIIPEVVNENNIILHNIDHHHDIQYEEWQIQDIENGKATHGAWIGNLIYLNRLKEYYWYNNLDSNVNFTNYVSRFVVNTNLPFFIEEELSKAEEIESYDLIFVCHSPDYLADNWQWGVLYQTYLASCKSLYNSKTTTQKLIPDMRNTPIHMKYNGETI